MGAQPVSVRSSDTFILIAMCFALFTDTFVYGMIVPILPYLLLDSGQVANKNVQTWTSILLASYGAALFIGSPLVGFLGDRYGSRKLPLVLGFVTIAAATIMFMVGRHPGVLIVARVLQGLSGAVVGVLCLALIAETAGKQHIGEYMAYGSMSFTWGMLSGPMIGGILFEKLGHTAAFAFPVTMLLIDVVLRLLIIEKKGKLLSLVPSESTDEQALDTDTPDNASSSSVNEESSLLPQNKPGTDSLSFCNFIHPRLLTALFLTVSVASVFSAFETTIPLYVKETYNWASSGAGLIFLPLTIPSFLTILIGRHAERLGPRKIITTAFLTAIIPIIALRFTEINNLPHQVLLVALLSILGICLSAGQALTMAEVSNAVHEIEAKHGCESEGSGMGRGYAFCNMAFAGGQFIGPVIGGLSRGQLGWGAMTLILAGICLGAGVPAFLFVDGWIGKKAKGKGVDKVNGNGEGIGEGAENGACH